MEDWKKLMKVFLIHTGMEATKAKKYVEEKAKEMTDARNFLSNLYLYFLVGTGILVIISGIQKLFKKS